MIDVRSQLGDVAVFARASETELGVLAEACVLRSLAKNDVLFVEGDASDAMYVVVSGRLKVVVHSERGDTLVLTVVCPGESLGELSIVDGLPRSAGAVALELTEVLHVPVTAVRRLMETSPAVCMAMSEDLAGRLRHATGVTADMVFLDLPRRLAKLLVAGGAEELPQHELAAQLGVTRQSLNRNLSGFQRRGWVTAYRGSVDVLDPAALGRFAES